ncbi:MAG: hypothetical protein V4489_00665, partial [Chlamydiota bacterium]
MIDSALPTLIQPRTLSVSSLNSTIDDYQSVALTGIMGYANFLTGTIGKALTNTYFFFHMTSILERIKQDPSKTSETLSDCNIIKEEDLKTIALALIEEDYKTLALSLHNFGIQDKDFLKELNERLKPYKITASLEKIKQDSS